jgi:hypothetical protein
MKEGKKRCKIHRNKPTPEGGKKERRERETDINTHISCHSFNFILLCYIPSLE